MEIFLEKIFSLEVGLGREELQGIFGYDGPPPILLGGVGTGTARTGPGGGPGDMGIFYFRQTVLIQHIFTHFEKTIVICTPERESARENNREATNNDRGTHAFVFVG